MCDPYIALLPLDPPQSNILNLCECVENDEEYITLNENIGLVREVNSRISNI
jgi:hypothetical protein